MNKLTGTLVSLLIRSRLQPLVYPWCAEFPRGFLSFSSNTVKIEVKYTALQSLVDWEGEQAKKIVSLSECIINNSRDLEWRALHIGNRWLLERRNLYLSEGILMHSTYRVVVPTHVKLHHDLPFAGHCAFETTLISLNKRYYWNFMPSQGLLYFMWEGPEV